MTGRKVPWWRTVKNTTTRSCKRTRVIRSTPLVFSSFRPTNVARGMSTVALVVSRSVYLGIVNGAPWSTCRDMLIALSVSFLTQCGNEISNGTQAPVDIPHFLRPIVVVPRSALLQSFRTSEIDKVERTFAGIPTRWIPSRYPKSEVRMRA